VRLWNNLARLAGDQGLPDRVVSALFAAAVGEVRRTTYQQDESFSRDQAIRDAEVERILALGARRVDIGQSGTESWTVLADPEGNEFCILRPKKTLIARARLSIGVGTRSSLG